MARSPISLYVRVGALVLVGLAGLIGFVLFFTSGRLNDHEALFETYIRESVQGLDVGSPVRYRGVRLGQVREITLVSAEYRRPEGQPFAVAFQRVLVRFSMDLRKVGPQTSDETVEGAVQNGLRARIASQGVTGVSYLELDFVDPSRYPPFDVPWQPRDPYIPSIPSTLAQVQNAAEALLQKLQGVDLDTLVGNINGLLTNLEHETAPGGDVQTVLQQASTLLRTLNTAVDQSNLPGTVSRLGDAATAARDLLGGARLRNAIDAVYAAAQTVRGVATRVPPALGGLQDTMGTLRGFTTDTQADLSPLLRDLRATVANLRELSEQLRRTPSSLLFSSPPPAQERSR